jgi:hypothetical protein
VGVVALGVVLTVLVALFVLKWAPEWLAQPDLKGKDRAEDVGRNRTAVLATIAGMIAVAGAIFTGLSYRLNRAGQITDRYSRAIDQLGATDESGKPKIDVILGGIYALERIARDSKDDHPQVVEVLTAYVREHARYKPANAPPATIADAPAATTTGEQGQDDEATSPHDHHARLATDIQAVMSVLARRDVSQHRPRTSRSSGREHKARLYLVDTELRGLRIFAGERATSNMPTSSGRISKGPTSRERTSRGRTSKGRASSNRTSRGAPRRPHRTAPRGDALRRENRMVHAFQRSQGTIHGRAPHQRAHPRGTFSPTRRLTISCR